MPKFTMKRSAVDVRRSALRLQKEAEEEANALALILTLEAHQAA